MNPLKKYLKAHGGDFDSLPASINFYMDRMKLMRQFPDKFFDIALVDPEYGLNVETQTLGSRTLKGKEYTSTAQRLRRGRITTGGGHFKNSALVRMPFSWDNQAPPKAYFRELFRVSKNQIIFGGNYFKLPPTRCMVVWDKKQSLDNYSAVEIAWTSYDKPAKLYSMANRGGDNKEKAIHPTQKPIQLYREILADFATEGMKILDTGTGSGSSRIAAATMPELALKFVGCENDLHYFNDERIRFERHQHIYTIKRKQLAAQYNFLDLLYN